MKRFQGEGKTVVVTGGGSGIGRACALAFGAAGATVHVVDLVDERAQAVCDELRHAGHRAEAHALDCSDAAAMQALADRLGPVDVLQNGVGVLVAAPLSELTVDDWRRAIDINLGSVINGVSAFLPGMLERGRRAHIVNIASVAGLVAFPYTAPYSTSKFAIVGMSQALTYELAGSCVGVTVVCPGMVRSNLVADGVLRLPDPWPRVFDRAYATIADPPERIAKAVLRAVHDNEPMVVPATLLPLLWHLERVGGRRFHRGARTLTGVLRDVGGWASRWIS